jgi:hypothetical protein
MKKEKEKRAAQRPGMPGSLDGIEEARASAWRAWLALAGPRPRPVACPLPDGPCSPGPMLDRPTRGAPPTR